MTLLNVESFVLYLKLVKGNSYRWLEVFFVVIKYLIFAKIIDNIC